MSNRQRAISNVPSLLIKILFGIGSFLVLTYGQNASAYEYYKKPVKKVSRAIVRPKPLKRTEVAAPPVFSASFAQAPIIPKGREPVEKETSSPSKIVNFRIHPVHLLYMIAQKDTLASVRGDVDFILSNRFTLGPSIIYHHTFALDEQATGSAANYLDESLLELGLLSNIYLTGTTSTGGILLRPHVYWIQPTGEKSDNAVNPTVTAATEVNGGLRGGMEVVYQHMLDCGLNFEIGGGLTYHALSYSIDYPTGNGTVRSEPSSRIAPTVTVGVGWAF